MTNVLDVLVLFGSQMGNSEQAAKEFWAESAATKLVSEKKYEINPIVMSLDDFLEIHQAQWTSLVVIFVSSYGVGHAPLGAYRFRELCDYIIQNKESKQEAQQKTAALSLSLKGLKYAMCGLGDSKYTTFFQNPTTIDKALQLAGAERVGPLGKADASAKDPDQTKIIQDWIESMWSPLQKVVQDEIVQSEKQEQTEAQQQRLKQMQMETLAICEQINPDFENKTTKTKKKKASPTDKMMKTTSKFGFDYNLLFAVFFGILALGAMVLLKMAERLKDRQHQDKFDN